MYSLAVITVSDKCSKGLREDASGALIVNFAKEYGFETIFTKIVPDEFFDIVTALNAAVDKQINLIITTGGTGFSPRDITPEATKAVIEREAMGIAEALRLNSAKYTVKAMLSRGVCGIKNSSIIVNLPGSPKAVRENIEFLLPNIGHGIDILIGVAAECGRKE